MNAHLPSAKGLIAKGSIVIEAPVGKVWDALTDPAKVKRYMFGADMITDWRVGSAIVWKGVWEGKPYEDKGTVLKHEEDRLLQYSYYSPMMGRPDAPENYCTVTIELSGDGGRTTVTLVQDNNATEEARAHSEEGWKMMLQGLKREAEA